MVFPVTKNLEVLIYGRQIRVASAAASGTGHCPALTLSNAVLWFASEVDTFLAIQLLVGAGRRGQLQLNHEISSLQLPQEGGE